MTPFEEENVSCFPASVPEYWTEGQTSCCYIWPIHVTGSPNKLPCLNCNLVHFCYPTTDRKTAGIGSCLNKFTLRALCSWTLTISDMLLILPHHSLFICHVPGRVGLSALTGAETTFPSQQNILGIHAAYIKYITRAYNKYIPWVTAYNKYTGNLSLTKPICCCMLFLPHPASC